MDGLARCEDCRFSPMAACGVLTWRAFSCRMVHFCVSMILLVICGLPKMRLMRKELTVRRVGLRLRPSKKGYLPRNYALLVLTLSSCYECVFETLSSRNNCSGVS